MLSYKHSFHAGNFADVHKHISLSIALNSLKRKEKPFCYIETHAGAGCYDLKGVQAQKNREFKQGISPLYSGLTRADSDAWPVSKMVRDYIEVIRQYNEQGLTTYPGSPLIAHGLLREQDEMALMELHPAESRKLKKLFGGTAGVHTHHRDGLEGLIGLVPPPQKRGLVLLDPSYELKKEYSLVREAVVKAHKRWAQGIYMVWYPILEEERHTGLITEFQRSGIKNIFHTQYLKDKESQRVGGQQTNEKKREGMIGSGLIVVNPPWKFAEQSYSDFKAIIKRLFPDDQFVGEWLVPE